MNVGTEIRSRILTPKIIKQSSRKSAFVVRAGVAAALMAALLMAPLQLSWSLAQAAGASVWWPTEGVRLAGTQPFKAVLDGVPVEQYEMFWQVDGGGWNWMDNNYTDYPHKEASVNLDGWTWRGAGPYKLNFIARQGGVVVAQKEVSIYVGASGAPAPVSVSIEQKASPKSVQPEALVQGNLQGNPLAGMNLYVAKNSPAKVQADVWRSSRPGDAAKMDILATTPTAQWLGGWSGNVEETVRTTVNAARAQGQAPVFIAYNIPGRDCGGYSAGGTSDYIGWIGGIARGIAQAQAVVVLEPDALAGIGCLSESDQQRRLDLLSNAVSILKSNPHTKVYVDAGHSTWIDAGIMAERLKRANVRTADGFALNVSNFMPTDGERSYGVQISEKLGGAHFVIDTSRNGNGSNGEWCNPWGRRIGERPTTATGHSRIDAYLWLKTPGESDGPCNGGPSAGTWWPEYALHLVP